MIREIENALWRTNTWTYEGMRRMFGGKLKTELHAHHLALAMLFRNGPQRLRFLEMYVPSVPLSDLEHIEMHQGANDGTGINAILKDYWMRPLSENELKAAIAKCARFYASLGAREWAAVLRRFSTIVFRRH